MSPIKKEMDQRLIECYKISFSCSGSLDIKNFNDPTCLAFKLKGLMPSTWWCLHKFLNVVMSHKYKSFYVFHFHIELQLKCIMLGIVEKGWLHAISFKCFISKNFIQFIVICLSYSIIITIHLSHSNSKISSRISDFYTFVLGQSPCQ